MKKAMLDTAHGGRDPGATGPTGLQEKDVSLDMVKRVAGELGPVAEVRMTREDDRTLGPTLDADLQARADMANEWGADIFVSIHDNSSENRTAHGCEVWTSPGQTEADALAECIIKAMEAALPEMSFRKDLTDGDSDKEERFAVLVRTNMPSVLIELGFISNPTEEGLLKNETFKARAARAIAEGIAGYLGVQLPDKSEGGNEVMSEQWELDVLKEAEQLGLIQPGVHQPGEQPTKAFVLAVTLNRCKNCTKHLDSEIKLRELRQGVSDLATRAASLAAK